MQTNIFQICYIFIINIIFSTFVFGNKLILNLDKLSSRENTIKFTIKNDSDEVIQIPKQYLPFSHTLSKDIFNIHTSSQQIRYIGKYVKYNPKEIEYIALEPQESFSTNLYLSDYYDLPQDEVITITYKSNTVLKHTIVQSSFSMTTSKEKNVSKMSKKTLREENQCTQSQINTIYNAKKLAFIMSQMTYSDVNYNIERYLTWFGSPTAERQQQVKFSLKNLYSTLKDRHIHFDCSCEDSYYAYVYPNNPYTIYLCNGFWNAKLFGTDSQAGTIIHQLSHFKIVANTKDYSYGEYEAKNLAKEFPNYAIFNADSYEYFIEKKFFSTSPYVFSLLAPILLLQL